MISPHYFPAANTPLGFYSRFDDIFSAHRAKRIIYIKGGPGTGKSTLMRNVAQAFEQEGAPVEYFHCSSDPDSLDAVAMPSRGIALLDGTAPHVMDPKYPGCREEIFDMGAFWNTDLLKEAANDIRELSAEISESFSAVYAFLKGAASLQRESERVIINSTKNRAFYDASRLIYELLGCYPLAEEKGEQRTLFLTGITPKGNVSYLETVAALCERKAVIRGWAPFTGEIITRVASAARDKGFRVELFYCPMNPEGKPEHLYVPELKLFVTTANEYHRVETAYDWQIDTFSYAHESRLSKHRLLMETLRGHFEGQLKSAYSYLEKAKRLHDQLESFYVPAMDFDRAKLAGEELLTKLKSI